jgi:heptosyltransferase-3
MTYLKDTPDFTKLRKVLIIKLRHLGDVLLATPVVSVLKTRYPHLQIDMLINEEAAELVAGDARVGHVLTYSRKKGEKSVYAKLSSEWGLVQAVRSGSYDLVINLTEGDRGNILAILSRAPYKVGQVGSKGSRWLSHTYKQAKTHRHSVEKDLDALRRLGIYPEDGEKQLFMAPFLGGEAVVQRFLDQVGLKTFYVIHAVSRWMYKSPRVQTFINLILSLNRPVVITGHDEGLEGAYLKAILQACPSAFYFPSQGSIGALSALIKRAEGLVTVDSLPLHIGSCLKVPTICLFGPTSEFDWGPWQNPHAQVVTYNKPCRACYQDGCGGGKLADCLEKITLTDLNRAIEAVFPKVE